MFEDAPAERQERQARRREDSETALRIEPAFRDGELHEERARKDKERDPDPAENLASDDLFERVERQFAAFLLGFVLEIFFLERGNARFRSVRSLFRLRGGLRRDKRLGRLELSRFRGLFRRGLGDRLGRRLRFADKLDFRLLRLFRLEFERERGEELGPFGLGDRLLRGRRRDFRFGRRGGDVGLRRRLDVGPRGRLLRGGLFGRLLGDLRAHERAALAFGFQFRLKFAAERKHLLTPFGARLLERFVRLAARRDGEGPIDQQEPERRDDAHEPGKYF